MATHTDRPCIECKYFQNTNPQCQHPGNRQAPNYKTGEGYIPHYYNSQFLRESSNYCGAEGKWFAPIDATNKENDDANDQ